MGEGHADFRPVVAAILSAITDAINMVRRFLAACCHDNFPFVLNAGAATIAALMRYERQRQKAGLQGRHGRSS
jgi:hypothetical protein